jgi:hypothetical protein
MKCINTISVRRLIRPLTGLDSLWAFGHYHS